MRGACVCIPSEEDRVNNLAGAIRALDANWSFLTPTVSRLLKPTDVPCLRTLVLGGEASSAADIRNWAGSLELIICYGPAETSIYCAGSEPAKVDSSEPSNVGHAIGGSFWITEPANHDKLTPVGCVGELLIEGRIVARGYLSDEAKTKEAFIQDPAWGKGRRLYKTGDLARFNTDGTVSILGRKDAQVKLRGQRIELKEIEHHTMAQMRPLGASDAVVEMIKPVDGAAPFLAAFISGLASTSPENDNLATVSPRLQKQLLKLEDALRDALPSYMVPSLFIPLARMPLTANGKRDRRRLQALVLDLSDEETKQYRLADNRVKRPVATDNEKELQSLWAEILNMPAQDIGADDSFFRLRGDSIAAMRLVSAAQKRGLGLRVADVFRFPCLSDLARTLDTSSEGEIAAPVEPFALLSADEQTRTSVLQEAAAQCGVGADAIEDVYPCTPLQEGLLALSSRQSGSYVAQNVFRLSEPGLDLGRFRGAWEATLAATEILRTRVVLSKQLGGTALQVVLGSTPITWAAATSLEAYVEKSEKEVGAYGDALARFALVNDQASGGLFFVWTVHHALYDGATLPLVLERFNQAYENRELAPSPGFNRFIAYLQAVDEAACQEFWRAQLNGATHFSFPGKPAAATEKAREEKMLLHSADLGALDLDERTNYTRSTVLRAAWALLLAQYGDDADDVVFGATIAGRNAPVAQIDRIVGPTIATVPVRIPLPREQTVREFLDAVQAQATDMIPYEHTGLQNIRQVSADARAACEFQNLLIVQPGEAMGDGEEESVMRPVDMGKRDMHVYPLVVECNLNDDTVDIAATYDENAVSTYRVQRMLYQFEHLIKQLYSAPEELKLGDVQLLCPQDEQQIWDWNAVEPRGEKVCAHHVVQRIARERPHAEAVEAWDGKLTYQQLDKQSNRLAHYLVGCGVGPEVMVAMCFDKSIWNVVAMLAVLKAGGACVALNPSHPMSRHRIILDDIKATVLLASANHKSMFDEEVRHVIAVDAALLESLPNVSGVPRSIVKPDNAAFIVFTSGSTGKPKEIVLTHEGLSTCTRDIGSAMRILPDSRVLQFAAHTFDVSIGEIFITLMTGGCVCVPSDEQRNNPAGAINTYNVNWCYLTPTVASLMQPSETPTLKTLVLGGEMVKQELVKLWADSVFLINAYGPAEATIWSTCEPGLSSTTSAGNIGKGVGSLTWIADVANHDRLCSIGAVGELLIEGPLLARLYLNEPEKTAAAFIENPAWLRGGGRTRRLYKTGDLAKYNADGTLEVLGRRDTQVKLFGQRIELGEIEFHLKPHLDSATASPNEVAVEMVKNPHSGQMLLAAFFSGAAATVSSETVGDDETRVVSLMESTRETLVRAESALTTVLPLYMVPSVYVPLNRMPKTVSGKTDRKALRQVATQLSESDFTSFALATTEVTPVSTEMEASLQRLWSQVLGLPESSIGANSNFLRLGGDSIGAMRLAAEARSQDLTVAVADVFRHPVLADLAAVMAGSGNEAGQDVYDGVPEPFSLLKAAGEELQQHIENAAAQCDVDASAVQDLYPATTLQEGLLSLSVKSPGAYVAQHVFELPSTIDVQRFRKAWATAVASIDILRTRIVFSPELGSLQVVLDQSIEWQTAQGLQQYLSEAREMEVIYGGVLTRYTLISEGNKHFFVWSVHHALFDGASIPMVMQKVSEAYDGLPSATQRQPFNSFIGYLLQTDSEATDAFWRAELEGASAPAFPPQPSSPTPEKRSIRKEIDLPIKTESFGVTRANVMKAAWAIILARYSETDDAIFGLTLSGRNAPIKNIATLVGPTITTVPLRIAVNQAKSVRAFVEEIQTQSVNMMPHEHLGLQKIQRLGPGPKAACEHRSLLVVQPRAAAAVAANNNNNNNDNGSLEMKAVDLAQDDFHTYSLVLECAVDQAGASIEAQYDVHSVPTPQMEIILGQFEHVARQLAAAISSRQPSETKISDITILSDREHAQILSWNSRVEPETVAACVHELVAAQAATRPSALAVQGWDATFTYAQLERAAERLAGYLAGTLGVGPEVLVPFCFDKSAWAVVAMLATLKAGGACVALNPAHPIDRLSSIVRETGAKVVLAGPPHSNLFDGVARTVVVDEAFVQSLPASFAQREPAQPNNPGFVVFTSGSTGVPKGIVLEHGALCSSAKAHGAVMRIDASSRVLQFAAYTFDVSIGEIFTTLMAGGSVFVPSEQERMNHLAAFIAAHRINWAYLTPTVASLLRPDEVPTLATLSLGGEAVKPQNIDSWADRVHLINIYGPAETTIWSTARAAATSAANIGFGVGAKMWVAEPADPSRLSPLGCAGELLIEGPILARGYLNEPSKTAAAFIEDPAWAVRPF